MSEWVSVKDRLPEADRDGLEEGIEDVLIAYRRCCERCLNDSEQLYITVGYCMGGEWMLGQPLSDDIFETEHSKQILVTHWMPLPEAPQ